MSIEGNTCDTSFQAALDGVNVTQNFVPPTTGIFNTAGHVTESGVRGPYANGERECGYAV